MPRGGKRTPREGKKIGRPKVERPLNHEVVGRIKKRVKAEELWVFLIATAAKKARETSNTSDLRQALEYLDDRELGRCVDTVNHLHDKPIEITGTIVLADVLEKARKRLAQR